MGKDRGEQVAPVDGLKAVDVVTVHRPVTTNTGREELANIGFHVCEMEAAGVLRASQGLPFSVIKVVSDTAGGDPEDKVIAKGPRPVRIARFMIRARLLSETHLVGALSNLVSGAL
jgi:nucleoside phosphorylase